MMLQLFRSRRRTVLDITVVLMLQTVICASAADYYAAADGHGDGSIGNPWNLATALESRQVQPGDTIYLRGGTYIGTYVSTISGSPVSPVIVRPYKRERVVLNGNRAGDSFKNVTVLRVEGGGYVHFQDLEVTNSDPERKIAVSGSNPGERRGSGVDVRAPGVKLINSIIHDTGTGLSAYAAARDFEAYGNLIFNNGWAAPDRGHGHGIYTQNDLGVKYYRDNIVLQQYGDGVHVYGSSAARLRNVRFTGNVLFFGRLLFGGDSPLENLIFENNMTYNANVEFGYGETVNDSIIVRNNYIAAGVLFSRVKNVTMEGNTVFNHARTNSSRCVGITPPPDYDRTAYRIDRNNYFQCTQNGTDFRFPGHLLPFAEWQDLGFDRAGTFVPLQGVNARPPGVKAFLRKNQYDPDRATLVIYNWEGAEQLPVDVSAFLSEGDRYELRNAQNYFGDVVEGIYDGKALNVRMAQRPAAAPNGADKSLYDSTMPEAGVFILIRTDAARGRKPQITAALNGASRVSGTLAPGMVAILTGEYIGPDDALDGVPVNGSIPGRLSDVRVRFDELPAPVLYASAREVAAIVPAAVEGRARTDVRVETSLGITEPFSVEIVPSAPALFRAGESDQAQARAWNEDGSENGIGTPARKGTFLRLPATGLGRVRNRTDDGTPASASDEPSLPVRAQLAGVDVNVEFTDTPPDTTGLLLGASWIRVRIPDWVDSGQAHLSISAGDQTSSGLDTIRIE